jgi:hypothetical protein
MTDQSIAVIVDKVGRTLQELVFEYQSKITSGIGNDPSWVSLLRNLSMAGCEFTPEELESLLPISTSLLHFCFGPTGFKTRQEDHDRWMPVAMATEGRTILRASNIEISLKGGDAPAEFIENAKQSKKLRDKRAERYNEINACNFWDFLL